MGGHGAWHFVVHQPDRVAALVPASGWLSKELYGDSNQWLMHDVSHSWLSPDVAMSLQASFIHNDADKHAGNLRHIPIHQRVGTKDRTVHPLFHRRMKRVLQAHGVAATVDELAGKEHWWWDSSATNDGGAVFDRTRSRRSRRSALNTLS